MPLLDWHNRAETLRAAAHVQHRLLRHDPTLSAGAGGSGNMLVQGDNLEALRALLPYYGTRVKCIFIDPPYNTGSAFEHYDDNLEHAEWLNMMYPRLELLRRFLREDGSIWVTIDDHQAHYLKVIMDELFGRKNFVANCVWQKRTSPDIRAVVSQGHDHVLVYSKEYNAFRHVRNKTELTTESLTRYKNPDNDPNGPWTSADFTAQGYRPNQMYQITTPSGKTYTPPAGRCWKNIESVFLRYVRENKIWFGVDGNGIPRKKTYLNESSGLTPWTWWTNKEVGHNQEGKKEINSLFSAENAFMTPKPERLLQRILHIASNPGDLVLDSFLGSGTTAAVAHKMGRRYLGIEMGEHAQTHCAVRLQKVIAGEQGGVSKELGWAGGGGFDFYHLGSPAFDEDGRIASGITFANLAAHVWFSETRLGLAPDHNSPLLGVHDGIAYYLLYNGILGDKRPQGGNVLTRKVLETLPPHNGTRVIYGESSRFSAITLERLDIVFKQTPYDLKD